MRILACVMALGLAGCGYRLSGTASVPEGARTITVKLFTNHTRDVGLDVALKRAIEDEFRRRGQLRVVQEGEGDLVLSGVIRRLHSAVAASSPIDEALQYQAVMTVDFRLVDRRSGHVLHETKALQEVQDFGTESGVVVTSSPSFQRGTINARDLTDMTNVQIGPSRRRTAVGDLVDVMAGDVYRRAMEGF